MSAFRQLLRHSLATALPRERFLVRGPAHPAGIALTFDDGPHAEVTPRVLDALATHGLKATFFVIGGQAERHPALIARMVHEGHAVGHHSWTHSEPARTSAAVLLAEIARCQDFLATITGTRLDRFRPPKGQLTVSKVVRLLGAGQRIVLWSSDPKDYALTDAAPLVRWARGAPLEPGDIVLLHDTLPHALSAIPILAERARTESRTFVTLDAWLPPARAAA